MTSRTPNTDEWLDEAAERTAQYLYSIDGDCSDELFRAIGQLRQLLNECYVHERKSVSSQFLFDRIVPMLGQDRQELARELLDQRQNFRSPRNGMDIVAVSVETIKKKAGIK